MNDMHGILFAYASNPQLRPLTEPRTPSSLPFGGRYRTIDFMLSNMRNAKVTSVGVIVRENYQSLLDHLGAGRDWDLARKLGGLKILPPFGYAGEHRDGEYRGKMEALRNVYMHIEHISDKYVVMADTDIICNLPLEEIYRCHVDSKADITCVCTRNHVGCREDTTFFHVQRDNRIAAVERGHGGTGMLQNMNVYILSTECLKKLCQMSMSRGFHDFERDILWHEMGSLNMRAYEFGGYFAQIQSINGYFRHNMDLLKPKVRADLFLRERPIQTKVRDEPSTYYAPGSEVSNSVVADGCRIEGTVRNSVIFRGCEIGKNAVVEDCILMQNTHIHANIRLSHVITDKDVRILLKDKERQLTGFDNFPIVVNKGVKL
jgi:glucose-1-phosphate adenylyltransferase